MFNNNNNKNLPRDLNGATTTTRNSSNVYRRIPQYRSLEVPTQPVAQLVLPQTKQQPQHAVAHISVDTKQQRSEERKPLPIPMIVANAPHNSIFLQAEPVSSVVSQVHQLLQRHLVDFEFNEHKFKWKCSMFAGSMETKFVARLFSVPHKPNYFLLDLARRCGCAMHFATMYKSLNNELLKNGFVVACHDEKPVEKVQVRALQALPLPAELLEEDEHKSCQEDFAPLLSMARSELLEVQRQGLSTLSMQLHGEAQVLASEMNSLLDLALGSSDASVKRLGLTCVALIAQACPSTVVNPRSLEALKEVVLDEHQLMESRRQTLKILQSLASKSAVIKTSLQGKFAVELDSAAGSEARFKSLADQLLTMVQG